MKNKNYIRKNIIKTKLRFNNIYHPLKNKSNIKMTEERSQVLKKIKKKIMIVFKMIVQENNK